MDRKLLTRAVILGLILHIVIVALYISSRESSSYQFVNYSNRRQQENEEIIGSDNTGNFEIELINSMAGDTKSVENVFESAAAHTTINEESVPENGLGESKGDNQSKIVGEYEKSHSKNGELPSLPSSSSSSSKSSLSSSSSSSSSSSLSAAAAVLKDSTGEVFSVQPAGKTLQDETHPQYNRAFPGNTIPANLLPWKPSHESAKYFQNIEGTQAFLYSAYYTNCTPPSVKLFGISARNKLNLGVVYCHYLDATTMLVGSMRGTMVALKDAHSVPHSPASAECPITAGLYPNFVTVTKTSRYVKESNMLPIHYSPEKPIRNFTLCFSPLHSFYNYTFQLVQSIELNKLLGASHFIFYNFSTTSQTDEILRYYEGQGLVTVLPWPLPHLQSWYFGQIAAINDCIYRNKMTSRYVVVVDTDEFVIPNRHSNWLELLNDVTTSPHLRDMLKRTGDGERKCKVLDDENSKSSPHYGSFMFRCSFFAEKPLSLQEEKILIEKNLKLTKEQFKFFNAHHSEPMLYLKSNDEIYRHESRSKLIVRPETIVSHAIHKTVEHVAGYQTAFVNTSAAFLHHYRSYKIKSLNTLDVTVLKFKDQFYNSLRSVVKAFPSIFTTK